MMDFASKAAAAVGVVLGAAYVAGLFQNFKLYSNLKSSWALNLIDLQGMIKDGLPIVMVYLFVAIVFFFFIRTLKTFRYLLSSLCLVFVLSAILVWFMERYNGHDEFNAATKGLIFGVVGVGVVGACLLSWSLHGFIEGKRSKFVLINVLIGMHFVLCLVPSVAGYLAAEDLKFGREQVSVLFNEKSDAVGLLVDIVGGKYLILDCNVPYQTWLEDISSKLKIRQAKGVCDPKY
jgi:hypothetical protein